MMVTLRQFLHQPPPGYVPGAALQRALGELKADVLVERACGGKATVTSVDAGVTLEAKERVERHFLMHIVALEFIAALPGRPFPTATIDIRHTGLFRRTGIECRVRGKHGDEVALLAEKIEGDQNLSAVLQRLDFRRCEVRTSAEGWTVLIEPYGASEVVNRKPTFRRYIPLGVTHSRALIQALENFSRVLVPFQA